LHGLLDNRQQKRQCFSAPGFGLRHNIPAFQRQWNGSLLHRRGYRQARLYQALGKGLV
jgi:hypothetical protein